MEEMIPVGTCVLVNDSYHGLVVKVQQGRDGINARGYFVKFEDFSRPLFIREEFVRRYSEIEI